MVGLIGTGHGQSWEAHGRYLEVKKIDGVLSRIKSGSGRTEKESEQLLARSARLAKTVREIACAPTGKPLEDMDVRWLDENFGCG